MNKERFLAGWPVVAAVSVTVVTWASAFAGIRAGLASFSPQSVALLRYGTASILLAVYAVVTRTPLPHWRDWPGIALVGFLGFSFYNVALNLGETRITAGTASLIVASAPIYVALLASIFYRERMTWVGWGGIGLSVLGVALISVDWRTGLDVSLSALLVLAAAIAQAIYTVSQKPFLRRYKPIQLTSAAIWAGTIFLFWFLPGLIQEVGHATLQATVAVVYMGIFPGALGYVCWAYVLSKLSASRAGTFLYLVPAAALLIAWLWLGERPEVMAMLGGVLVVGGVVVVNFQRVHGAAVKPEVRAEAVMRKT